VIAVRHDDDEVQALQTDLGASAEASPAMADLEGRGELDVIVATSDGTVHALRPDGSRVPAGPSGRTSHAASTRRTRATTSARAASGPAP
jgi:hypothetical protein